MDSEAALLQEEDEEEDSDDGELIKSAEELAGMRVKHGADELNEGETMILTLADRNILDSKGEIDDEAEELENALMVIILASTQRSAIINQIFFPDIVAGRAKGAC